MSPDSLRCPSQTASGLEWNCSDPVLLPKGGTPMTDQAIVTQLPLWTFPLNVRKSPQKQPDLHTHWQFSETLPATTQESPTIKRCLDLLAPLDWGHLPERNLTRNWGQATIP